MFWIDLETGGLDPVLHGVLEIGIIVTDSRLNKLATFRALVLPNVEGNGDVGSFAEKMHRESGLLDEILHAGVSLPAAIDAAGKFLDEWKLEGEKNNGPMFGSSVHFDRAFLAIRAPEIAARFHYRNVDVSSFKEAFEIFGVEDITGDWPRAHKALEDIDRSILEFAEYMRVLARGLEQVTLDQASIAQADGVPA